MAEFQTELQAYKKGLEEMLKRHAGEYVVIKGNCPTHFSRSYEGALDWGYNEYGLADFFVKRVSAEPDVAHFTRDLGPCRT